MPDAVKPVQTAVYAKLNGAISASVFDRVPATQAFPYVLIGDDTAIDASDKLNDGQEITLTLHQYSQAKGRDEVKTLQGECYDLLHNGSLTVVGWTVRGIEFEYSDTLVDPDGKTYHGVQRFRLIVDRA